MHLNQYCTNKPIVQQKDIFLEKKTSVASLDIVQINMLEKVSSWSELYSGQELGKTVYKTPSVG